MKIITKHVVREFLQPLLFSTVAFGGLVMISEFFRELNFYLEKKAAFSAVFHYLFLNLPWWIIQVLPVSVLLAVLFSLGGLARQGEITALKASGVNLWRIVGVLFLCGLAIGGAEIFLREKVIPYTIVQAEKVRKEKIEKETVLVQTEFSNLVIALPPNGRMTIGSFNVARKRLYRIVIDFYDDEYNLSEQVVAQEGVWQEDGSWLLSGGVRRTYSNGAWQEKGFDSERIMLTFHPEDFIIAKVRPEQMPSPEFKRYIGKLEAMGIPAARERIQFHIRWAAIFSHIIVMLIGIPFAIGLGSRHGKFLSFTFALIFAFLYWGVQAVGQSLGENGVVPPAAAAWIGNAVFGIVGTGLMSRIRR